MQAGTHTPRTRRRVRRSLPFVLGLALLATVGAEPAMHAGHGPVGPPGVAANGRAAHDWARADFAPLTGAVSGALTRSLVADTPLRAQVAGLADDALAVAAPAKLAKASDSTVSSEPGDWASGPADAVPLTPPSVPAGLGPLHGARPPAILGQRAPPARI
jgi:hypothetical protein